MEVTVITGFTAVYFNTVQVFLPHSIMLLRRNPLRPYFTHIIGRHEWLKGKILYSVPFLRRMVTFYLDRDMYTAFTFTNLAHFDIINLPLRT